MERTLKTVLARHAIEAIVFGYAEAVDSGRLERLVTLLAGCEVVMPDGESLQGGRAVADHYAGLLQFYDAAGNAADYGSAPCTPLTKHVTSNLQFEFDNAVASADVRSYFTVYQGGPAGNAIVAGGRYLDRFVETMHGWQLTRRAIRVDHQGDMSHHVRGDHRHRQGLE